MSAVMWATAAAWFAYAVQDTPSNG
jgi:hypothetical protein